MILAGGDGQRIGGNKAMCMLGGRRLIDHALATAALWSADCAVAVRRETVLTLPEGVSRLVDADVNGGPLSGIMCALDYAYVQGADQVMVIPCDMPFLPRDLFLRLSAQRGDALVAMPRCAEQVMPVCSLWKVMAKAHLTAYLSTGGRSPFGFAQRIGLNLVDWSHDAAEHFANINHAEDLTNAEARLAQKSSI